jgi:hypothetical protein
MQVRKAENQTERLQVAMFSPHKKIPADLKQANQLPYLSFKVRDQRLVTAGAGNYWLSGHLPYHVNRSKKTLLSSFHLPHLRRLLFPKHYFW